MIIMARFWQELNLARGKIERNSSKINIRREGLEPPTA